MNPLNFMKILLTQILLKSNHTTRTIFDFQNTCEDTAGDPFFHFTVDIPGSTLTPAAFLCVSFWFGPSGGTCVAGTFSTALVICQIDIKRAPC